MYKYILYIYIYNYTYMYVYTCSTLKFVDKNFIEGAMPEKKTFFKNVKTTILIFEYFQNFLQK